MCLVSSSTYDVHCFVRANIYLATCYVQTVDVFCCCFGRMRRPRPLTHSLTHPGVGTLRSFFVSFLSGARCAGVPRRLGTTFHRDRIRRGPHRGPLPSHAVLLRAGSCRGREGCCFCVCRCCLYQVIVAGWKVVVDHYIPSDYRRVDVCAFV